VKQSPMRLPINRIAVNALLLSFALILSYLESLLPLPLILPIPGVKLGLANVCIMLAFFTVGKGDAFVVSLLRVCLAGLLFSSPTSTLFSLSGALFAFGGLLLLAPLYRKEKISFLGLSVASAALHQIGQLTAAACLYRGTAILRYLPILLIASVFTGLLTGYLLQCVYPRLNAIIHSLNKGENHPANRERR